MRYLLLTMIILAVGCSQGVRVENQSVDEIEVLTSEVEPANRLRVIGHKTGSIYTPEVVSSGGIEGEVTKILQEEEDIFVVYKDSRTILSVTSDNFDLIKSYNLNDLGEPLDLVFPNTSNGYFTVEGKDSLYILDRISQEIASIKIPVAGQPTKLIAKGNRLFVANSTENILSVVTTNTKVELARIQMPGIIKQLDFRDGADELVAICQLDNGFPIAVFIDTNTLGIITETNLLEGEQTAEFPEIKSLLISPSLYDFIWVGTDEGVFRLNFRIKNQVLYVFLGVEVLGIHFNSREIDNDIFYLGRLADGTTKLEVVDAIRFNAKSQIILENEVQYIYPFF